MTVTVGGPHAEPLRSLTSSGVGEILFLYPPFRCHISQRMHSLGFIHTIAAQMHRHRPPRGLLYLAVVKYLSRHHPYTVGGFSSMNTTRGSPLVVHNSNYVVNHIDRPTRDIWICSLKSSPRNPHSKKCPPPWSSLETSPSSPADDALVVIAAPGYKSKLFFSSLETCAPR